MKKPGKCIDGDKVPCEKARNYLGKKGLLCPVTDEQKPEEKNTKKRKKKGWFARWFD